MRFGPVNSQVVALLRFMEHQKRPNSFGCSDVDHEKIDCGIFKGVLMDFF
jgi:hypothetical protein